MYRVAQPLWSLRLHRLNQPCIAPCTFFVNIIMWVLYFSQGCARTIYASATLSLSLYYILLMSCIQLLRQFTLRNLYSFAASMHCSQSLAPNKLKDKTQSPSTVKASCQSRTFFFFLRSLISCKKWLSKHSQPLHLYLVHPPPCFEKSF